MTEVTCGECKGPNVHTLVHFSPNEKYIEFSEFAWFCSDCDGETRLIGPHSKHHGEYYRGDEVMESANEALIKMKLPEV
tara:strand:+ start:6804 stop:7040 length:237 start_codon:yes stop_codon:yes gene_type:complete